MLEAYSYLYNTIKQEIVDEMMIFREIAEYYADSMYQRMMFKKKLN